MAPRTKAIRATAFAAIPMALGAVALGSPAFAANQATPHPAASAGYSYRHGAVPQLGASHHASTAAGQATTTNMYYHGGTNGIGVVTGPPKVYIVYWGSQWGTASTDGSGDTAFSNDAAGMAPYQQAFFKGLGTGGELWSGVMTQYCQGIASGSSACSASNPHVGYPTGGALAGVWYDNSAAAPSAATAHQMAQEAINAAAHFGNTTAASQRNVQYIITSPTGTDPDGYQSPTSGYCAYHDYTGDPTMSGGPITSPYGDLAWTNMPYIIDVGATCGSGFVNSGNQLDGVSIVGGHEFAETVTDQFPYQASATATDISTGGWTAGAGNRENGDLCAWVSSGTGASRNLNLTTGTFAVQTTWGNDTTSCEFSHAIVGGSTGNTVTVANPGSQTGTVGTAVSLQVSASDSASGQTLTYSATGLPAGLSISSSGLISGTPTTAATSTVTVTATDATGASGSASFSFKVSSSSGGGCTAAQLIGNGGFESGAASPWTLTAGVLNSDTVSEPAHSGSWDAWLDGYGSRHTDTAAQTVTVPSTCVSANFSFWLHIDTAKTTTSAVDTLKVQVLNSSGTVLATLGTYSNANANSGYSQHSFSLASYAGQKVTLKFTGTETGNGQTSFVLDDAALNVN